jgi:hypothetical protein
MGDGDPLEATTRNYGRQGPALASAGSAPLPPSIGDAVAGDTARYQQQVPVQPMGPMGPIGPMGPAYMPPGRMSVADTASFKGKKRRRFVKWGAVFLAMLMSVGIGAAINEESNDGRIFVSMEDRARLDRMRTEDQLRRTMTDSITDYQDRMREDIERKIEAIDRAKEEAERAAERGDPGADVKPIDLTSYEYQGATGGQYSRIPGRELLTQRTKDDFETVRRFYQEKLGQPLIQVNNDRNDRNQRQAFFQSVGSPSATVLIRETRDRARQLEIIILRSPFRFPSLQAEQEKQKAEDAEKATAEAKKATK